MIENSSAGLVMLHNEVPVTVTGEEHHQAVLARYPVPPGGQRFVAVELGWCTIRSGKYRGQRAIEVRLDGQRVGELTHLMSQRYGPLLAQVTAQGGRPGCAATIQRGERKLEILLRLPNPPAAVPAPRKAGAFAPNKPVWIGVGAVVAILLIIVIASTGRDNASPTTTSGSQLSTPTSTAVPTTTPTTTAQPTTTVPPAPPPPATTQPPAPKTTTKTQPPPPPPAEEPPSQCDPNYTPCVPIASDVDCAGGSGNGPAYVKGPVRVIGRDIYDLDRDHDGIGCES